jgi:TetR/AcrR family transcriptional regulator, fatty acid metabolism regulator protein
VASKTARKSAVRLSIDDRTADIMTAARVVIAAKGYENTLLSDIAREADIAEGTIYRYFQNKRDLLVKVAEVWFNEQLAEDSQLESIHGTWNKLRHLAWRTLTIIKKEPVLSRFMLMELRPDPNYRATPFFELNRRFTQEALEVCRNAVASGEFHDDVSPATLRDMLYGCIEHRTWAFLRGEGRVSVEEVADGVAKVIYRGMAVAQVPAPSATEAKLEDVAARLEKVAATLESRATSPR